MNEEKEKKPPDTLASPIRAVSGEGNTVKEVKIAGEVKTKTHLERSAAPQTADQALWVAIRNRTQAISFNRYSAFIDKVFCTNPNKEGELSDEEEEFGKPKLKGRKRDLETRSTIHGVDAYNLLRF